MFYMLKTLKNFIQNILQRKKSLLPPVDAVVTRLSALLLTQACVACRLEGGAPASLVTSLCTPGGAAEFGMSNEADLLMLEF